jgi:hypothetical protein
MIPFEMIVLDEFRDRPSKMALADRNQPIEAGRSGNTFRNGDCSGATARATFNVLSNTGSPVAVRKSATMIVSRTGRASAVERVQVKIAAAAAHLARPEVHSSDHHCAVAFLYSELFMSSPAGERA